MSFRRDRPGHQLQRDARLNDVEQGVDALRRQVIPRPQPHRADHDHGTARRGQIRDKPLVEISHRLFDSHDDDAETGARKLERPVAELGGIHADGGYLRSLLHDEGTEFGGTWIRAAAVDQSGVIVSRSRARTESDRAGSDIVSSCVDLIRQAAAEAPLTRVGVSVTGPVDPATGTIFTPPNTGDGLAGLALGDELAHALNVAIVVDRDTNAAALAEWRYGAARGAHDFVYLTLSTGVGGAVMLDDRLIRGEDVAAAAHDGDSAAIEVLKTAGAAVASAAVDFTNAFNPSLIVIGGSVAAAHPDWIQRAHLAATTQALDPARGSVRVVGARLGDDGGLIGAALLAAH